MTRWLCKSFCCLITILSLINFKLIELKLIFFCNKLSFFECYLKTVCSRCISCCRNKYTSCAIWKLQICGYIILNLDIMPLSVMTECTYL